MTEAFFSSGRTMNKTVTINASTAQVWHVLTTPDLMKKWMLTDVEIEIITDWKVGSPMSIRGNMNGKDFENTGQVLQFEPERILQYSHLSSLSRLPDVPESYSIIEFKLTPVENQTALALTVRNFPTESIYKHLTFYWNVTLEVLKRLVEKVG
ncbi:MAG: SRPBCC domain-containing protein [Anaerolineales bacterium]|nr:SRPBCC domain-containing protein [Anaerolineales bacterium]